MSTTSVEPRSAAMTRQFLEDYSQQLILGPDCNWDDLLSAAPRTLVCLGQAFVAVTSNNITPVQVQKVDPLESTSLRANLQHCADMGQEAFLETEGRMQQLHRVAGIINSDGGIIDKILRLCEHETLAKTDLPRLIERAKKLSQDCVENTKIVQDKFEAWATLAAAIKRACLSSEDFARNASHDLKNERAREGQTLNYQEEELQAARQRLEHHREMLQHHAQDMREAQRKIPKGTQAVGVRAADAVMNGIGMAAKGAGAAFMGVTKILAAGGPTLNLKMTTNPPPPPSKVQKKAFNTLEKARANHESSKKAFLESQKRYEELERNDREAKDKFQDMQLQLQRLSREDVSMVQVMEVLTNCIANLTNFQDNIIQLRRFFNGIYRYTEDIDRTVLADFLDSANQLSAADPSTKEECQERTKYYLEEIQRDAEKLRRNYSVAGELSATYVQISEKHIMPGVTQVNRLMVAGSSDISGVSVKDKVKQINTYARKAQSEISTIATQHRERVRDQLYDVERQISEAGDDLDAYAEGGWGEEEEEEDGGEWADLDDGGDEEGGEQGAVEV